MCHPIDSESSVEFRRVLWRSRRGMLELDLLLRPFAETQFLKLPRAQQTLFKEFLTLDDVVLFAILQKQSPAGEFETLVSEILAHRVRHSS